MDGLRVSGHALAGPDWRATVLDRVAAALAGYGDPGPAEPWDQMYVAVEVRWRAPVLWDGTVDIHLAIPGHDEEVIPGAQP